MIEHWIRFLVKNRYTRFLLDTIVPISFWGYFLYNHVEFFLSYGGWATFIYAISHSILILLFLIRNTPKEIETNPRAWFWALLGTLAPTLLTPGTWWLTNIGQSIVLIGFCIQILALISLGRNFGVIAANRGISTQGMYRIVRHPIYLAYYFYAIGYITLFPSLTNILCMVVLGIATLFRIREEEYLLGRDAAYRAYQGHVRWKLIPYVY